MTFEDITKKNRKFYFKIFFLFNYQKIQARLYFFEIFSRFSLIKGFNNQISGSEFGSTQELIENISPAELEESIYPNRRSIGTNSINQYPLTESSGDES